jgi:uncharacterized protein
VLLSVQIQTDLAAAMRDHNDARTAVLRLIKNALKNEEIKLRRELTSEEELKVLQKEAKQRRDSIEAYRNGGRADLADSEQSELDQIIEYLPQQMGEEELNILIDRVIVDSGATGPSQMGTVIGLVLKEAAGKADGGAVSRLVKAKLG